MEKISCLLTYQYRVVYYYINKNLLFNIIACKLFLIRHNTIMKIMYSINHERNL